MIVYIIKSESIIDGEVVKELSFEQALWWVRVLTQNKVKHSADYKFVDQPKQLEFVF